MSPTSMRASASGKHSDTSRTRTTGQNSWYSSRSRSVPARAPSMDRQSAFRGCYSIGLPVLSCTFPEICPLRLFTAMYNVSPFSDRLRPASTVSNWSESTQTPTACLRKFAGIPGKYAWPLSSISSRRRSRWDRPGGNAPMFSMRGEIQGLRRIG